MLYKVNVFCSKYRRPCVIDDAAPIEVLYPLCQTCSRHDMCQNLAINGTELPKSALRIPFREVLINAKITPSHATHVGEPGYDFIILKHDGTAK